MTKQTHECINYPDDQLHDIARQKWAHSDEHDHDLWVHAVRVVRVTCLLWGVDPDAPQPENEGD